MSVIWEIFTFSLAVLIVKHLVRFPHWEGPGTEEHCFHEKHIVSHQHYVACCTEFQQQTTGHWELVILGFLPLVFDKIKVHFKFRGDGLADRFSHQPESWPLCIQCWDSIMFVVEIVHEYFDLFMSPLALYFNVLTTFNKVSYRMETFVWPSGHVTVSVGHSHRCQSFNHHHCEGVVDCEHSFFIWSCLLRALIFLACSCADLCLASDFKLVIWHGVQEGGQSIAGSSHWVGFAMGLCCRYWCSHPLDSRSQLTLRSLSMCLLFR